MYRIPESELLLNQDGSIYHLNLHPSEIANTIINVGDPDRVKMVSYSFDSIEVKKQKREFVTHTGFYKGKRITVISTGIGTDNIDIVYNELDTLVNIDLKTRTVKENLTSLNLIRIGTSGSLHEDIPVDSFVFSTHGLALDALLNFYKINYTAEETQLSKAFREHYPQFSNQFQPVIVGCSSILEKALSHGMHKGITASCPGFYAPQGRILRYELTYPDLVERLNSFKCRGQRIANFEMETSAMYGLSRILGHHCCSVNTIVANRITKEHSRNTEEAMRRLIQLVLDRLVAR